MMKYFARILIIPLLLIACNDDDMKFDIGSDQLDVNAFIGMIDTLSVKSYTVMLDSISTSGLNSPAVIIGNYQDEEFGTVSASHFLRVSLPSKITSGSSLASYEITEDAVFDSIRFFLVYNTYYEGDTTLPFTINVHRLNEALEPHTDGYFYNTDSIACMPGLIGQAEFSPWPNSGDTVWISLDNSLGMDLFEKMKVDHSVLLDNNYFQEYFRGMMLRYDESNNAILGFHFPVNQSATSIPAMRIYYHYSDDLSTYNKFFDFQVQIFNNTGRQVQFNRFTLRNSKVSFPSVQHQNLPASATNHRSYIHAGLGIVTRLEIPSLKDLYFVGDDIRILDARLMLEPVGGTYTEYTLPADISLYATDDMNRWGSNVRNKAGNLQNGSLTVDMIYHRDTRYTFDITSFLISRLEAESAEVPAMLLTISPEDLYKSCRRLILGSSLHEENKVRLKVYYMKVK